MIPRYALTYGGDIDACIKYIPFAQNLLAHAAQSGQQVLRRQINDTDWLRVDVNKWGVSAVHIEAGSADIYLESGFYDLLSSATCTENTYKPAILHYNTPIGAYINSLDKPTQGKLTNKLEGEKLLDGYTSLSVGGKKLQTTVTDFCGNTYVSSVPAYSIVPEKTLMQKQVQNRIPSSMFSGKMRLYVQALYGSPRTDYRINVDLNGLPNTGDYKLYVEDTQQKDFELVWEYPYTAGIFTTNDYKYYVMKVVTSEIRFYPLVLSSAAEAIRRALITSPQISDPDFVSRIEAYLLSTGKIDTKNAFTIPITGAVSIGGGPFAYGWKFSQSGKKCTIVIHGDISPLGNMKKFQASELTVTINEAEGVFTASMVVTKTGTWSHNTWFVPWTPDFYQFSQVQNGRFDTGADMNTGACPLYGWYEGEIYRTLDININIYYRSDSWSDPPVTLSPGCGPQTPSTWSSGVYNGYNGTGKFIGLASDSFTAVTASSVQDKTYYLGGYAPYDTFIGLHAGGFSDGAAAVICESGMSVINYLTSIGAYTYSPPNSWNIKFDSNDGTYSYGRSARTYYQVLVYDYTARTGVSDTGKLTLIIPLLDAEACSTGHKQTKSASTESLGIGGHDSNSITLSKTEIINIKQEHSSQNITILGVISEYSLSKQALFSYGNSPVTHTIDPDHGNAAISIVPKRYGNYYVEEDGYAIKESSGTAASAAWSDDYLWATFGTTLGGKTIVANSSFNGANITWHGENTGENKNGYRNHSAVGWA